MDQATWSPPRTPRPPTPPPTYREHDHSPRSVHPQAQQGFPFQPHDQFYQQFQPRPYVPSEQTHGIAYASGMPPIQAQSLPTVPNGYPYNPHPYAQEMNAAYHNAQATHRGKHGRSRHHKPSHHDHPIQSPPERPHRVSFSSSSESSSYDKSDERSRRPSHHGSRHRHCSRKSHAEHRERRRSESSRDDLSAAYERRPVNRTMTGILGGLAASLALVTAGAL